MVGNGQAEPTFSRGEERGATARAEDADQLREEPAVEAAYGGAAADAVAEGKVGGDAVN